ncbi:MAG: galactokinase [Candidatus Thorarchaeota archaeon]
MDVPDILTKAFVDLDKGKSDSAVVSRAPGRIEILGNHTDYNGGLVLTSTVDQFVWTMGIPSTETILHSINYGETVRFNPNNVEHPNKQHWSNYARGVYWAFNRRHHSVLGLTGVIHGDIPQGGGLGSSAAMEVSLVNHISHISKLKILPKAKAMLAYEAERLFCGISCGVMDQFTSQLGKPNALLGIHCGNMMTQDVTLPENIKFIVLNSMVTRPSGDILNERRAECLKALTTLTEANWDIHSLSAISASDLHSVSETLDEVLTKRVTHVVNENQRVRDGIAAIKDNNLKAFGKIMIESHISTRDLFEVSHPKQETLMEITQQRNGILGSRLTGTGLGENLLILSKQKTAERVLAEIIQEYEHETGLKLKTVVCSIPGGVVVEDVTI